MLEIGFLIFGIVLLYFSEFSFLNRVRTEFRTKIFFSLSTPISSRFSYKKCRKDVFEFCCCFFHNFLARVKYERNSGLKFFFSFSAYLIPFWRKIMPKRCFLIFWIFLLFYPKFSYPGLVWTEFGTKFFFLFLGLSHLVLAINNAGKRFFNFLNFFAIFF